MTIRWDPTVISEGIDQAEKRLNEAYGPLKQARLVIQEVRRTPNLPQYVDQSLLRIIGEIDSLIGGVRSWDSEPYPGRFGKLIASARDALPKGQKVAPGVGNPRLQL